MTGGQHQSLARKQPLQARSKASLIAILDATVQILSTRRTAHLTTKAIAELRRFHVLNEGSVRESWCDDTHADLTGQLLPQTISDGQNCGLCRRIDNLICNRLTGCGGPSH
jgi:hypothetical protein